MLFRSPLGPNGKLLAEYGAVTMGSQDVDAVTSDRKTFSLGYDYTLSKRTDVYLGYMHDHKSATPVGLQTLTYENGQTYALGLRHKF